MNERFGELRALLQQTPSEALWDALCEELLLWDAVALERVALPYVDEHLARWPEEIERRAEAGALVTLKRVVGATALKELASRGHIRWVELSLGKLGESAVRGVIKSLEQIKPYGIDLEITWAGDGSGAALLWKLDAPWLRNLSVEAPGLGDAVAANISDNPKISGLRRLSVATSDMTHDGARSLASAAHLSGLRWLDLSRNKLGDRGLRALLESTALAQLTTFKLANCGLGPKAATLLAEHPDRARIAMLELSGNRLGPATPKR